MRIVVDTNVLISGVLFGGVPGKIIEAWHGGVLRLVMSPEIVDEYLKVSERLGDRYPDVDIQPVLVLIVHNSEIVPDSSLTQQVCDDPDDDKFLACAHSSETKLVVSGDKKLQDVSGYEGSEVISPREFITRLP